MQIQNHLQIVAHQVPPKRFLGFIQDSAQGLLQMRLIIGKSDDADLRALPGVLIIQFGDGDIKTRAEAFFQAAQHLSFVFERPRVGDVDFQSQETDRHLSHLQANRHSLRLGALKPVEASAKMSFCIEKHLEYIADLEIVGSWKLRRRTFEA